MAMPVIALVTSPVLARALGPEGRGEVAAISAPLTLAESVAAWGLPLAAAYFVAKGASNKRVFNLAFPIALLAGTLSFLTLFLLAPVLLSSEPHLVGLFRAVSAYIVLVAVIGLIRGIRNGEERYSLLSLERWIQAISRLVLILVLAAVGHLTTTSAVLINVGCALLAALVLLSSRKTKRRQEPSALSRATLVKYSFSSWGTQIASAANARLDQALLILFVSAQQLGFYVVAAMAVELPMTLFNAMQRVVIGSGSAAGKAHRIARAARFSSVLVVVIAAAGIPIAPHFVHLLFGSAFDSSIPLLQILLLGVIPWGLGQVLTGGLVAVGAAKFASRAEFFSLILTAAGIVFLTPEYGVTAAAWVSVAAYLAATAVKLIYFVKRTEFSFMEILIPTKQDLAWVRGKLLRA